MKIDAQYEIPGYLLEEIVEKLVPAPPVEQWEFRTSEAWWGADNQLWVKLEGRDWLRFARMGLSEDVATYRCYSSYKDPCYVGSSLLDRCPTVEGVFLEFKSRPGVFWDGSISDG